MPDLLAMEIQSILTGIFAPVSSPPKDTSTGTSSLEEKTDAVRLSPEGKSLADGKPATENSTSSKSLEEEETEFITVKGDCEECEELTEEERQEVEELKKRDREVRAHEQAHKATAGQYAKGGPSFEFEQGPDGRRYAVGGEVKIDASEVPGDPQATILKAQTIRRAANAPADPSGQDRQVAAQATTLEAKARRELSEQRLEESQRNQTPENSAQEQSSTTESGAATSETNNQGNESEVPSSTKPESSPTQETRKNTTSDPNIPAASLIQQFDGGAQTDVGSLLDILS